MTWQAWDLVCPRRDGPDHVLHAMDYLYQYVLEEVRMQDELPLDAVTLREFFKGIATIVFHPTV